MCLLFETIKINDGRPENILFHNRRMNGSRKALFGCDVPVDLNEIITVPAEHRSGKRKCRVVYSERIQKISFEAYPGKTIRSLKIVRCDDIEYPHKFRDRERLSALYGMRGPCDEILIVKDNRVTDTSISNIAFFDGSRWVTPRTFLLQGTKRAQLISDGTIIESDITEADIASFSKASLINAMLDLGEATVEIDNIIY